MKNSLRGVGGASSRRVGRNAAAASGLCSLPTTGAGAVRLAFGAAAALIVALNELVVVLWPLWPSSRPAETERLPTTPSTTTPPPQPRLSPSHAPRQGAAAPRRAAAWLPPAPNDGVAPPIARYAQSWQDLESPLRRLSPGVMRLLPDRIGEDDARRSPCWLAFGISSVKRVKADYLGVTLSHLFNALAHKDKQLDTAIVVHLADFDETWVSRTSAWLGAGFADEVEERKLHVIHAPRQLYPERRMELASIVLGNFKKAGLNGEYSNDATLTVGGRETYWSKADRRHFVYWCTSKGRWALAEAGAVTDVLRGSNCSWISLAPKDCEFLNTLPRGWEEQGMPAVAATEDHAPGVMEVQSQVNKFNKFGDTDKREWWRSKQNLDYAFLMWYATGLSDYYMQLEDDVQVVPGFLQSVHKYVQRVLLEQQWFMVAFSKMGFIGKFFNSTWLPSLANFLLVFYAELPCDWLVWTWIDAVSPTPVTMDIVEDERVHRQKIAEEIKQRKNASVPLKMGRPREELALFYTESPHLVAGMFSMPEPLPSMEKPVRSVNGRAVFNFPAANVATTFKVYDNHAVTNVYPAGVEYFWSQDTCWESGDPKGKYIEVVFHHPVSLQTIKIHMGSEEHAADYIRSGSLQVSYGATREQINKRVLWLQEHNFDSDMVVANITCGDFVTVAPLESPNVEWTAPFRADVRCIRLTLSKKQQEWIMVRSIEVFRFGDKRPGLELTPKAEVAAVASARPGAASLSSSAPPEAVQPPNGNGEAPVAQACLALLAGILAGAAGWALLHLGWRRFDAGVSTVGAFTCWSVSFVLVLDVLLLALLTPPVPPILPHTEGEGDGEGVGAGRAAAATGEKGAKAAGAWGSSAAASDSPSAVRSLLPAASPGVDGAGEASRVATAAEADAESGTSLQAPEGITWQTLVHGVNSLPLQRLLVLGNPPPERGEPRHWMTVGMIVDVGKPLDWFVKVIGEIINAGSKMITVAVFLTDAGRWVNGGPARAASERGRLLASTQATFNTEITAGLLRIFHAPDAFYPGPPMRDDNVDNALLLTLAAPLGDSYTQVESGCAVTPRFLQIMREYMDQKLKDKQWLGIFVSKTGFLRHVIRPRVMTRLAEMLLLVPDAPIDALFWDTLDVVSNETAPKSIYLATLASRSMRRDVILQYFKAEALIEHLGDVSSLEGKVQRIRDDYFKKHAIKDTLYDSPPPPAVLRTNLQGRRDMLQAVYDATRPTSVVVCGGHMAQSCDGCPQGHGAGWCNEDCTWVAGKCQSVFSVKNIAQAVPLSGSFIEIRFNEPTDIELVRVGMGGMLRPQKKGMANDGQSIDHQWDTDFDSVLDDADLQFGRGVLPSADPSQPSCSSYYWVDRATGREVFWRSTRTRPALNISCITISIPRKQLRPLILRDFKVRRGNCVGQGSQRSCGAQALLEKEGRRKQPPFVQPQLLEGPRPRLTPTIRPELLDRWSEQHFAWALTVSVAFVSGAVAGILGGAVRVLFPGAQSQRRRR